MNSKFFFAVLAITMLLASGCVYIRMPGKNATDEDIEGDVTIVDGFEAPVELTEEEKALPTKLVNEGELVEFPNLKAVDPDGDAILYTFSEPLSEDGEWQTTVGDAGKYTLTITASDGTSEVSQQVLLIVKSLNNAPEIEDLETVYISEGETVLLNPAVSDVDGDNVEISFSGWMESSKKKTDLSDSGSHTVTIIATDGKETVTKQVTIVVSNVNQPPVIEGVADIELDEGEIALSSVSASDPDGDNVEVSFSEPLDEDGEWQTTKGDAGKYVVRVTASDGQLEVQESFSVRVITTNAAPEFEGVADVSVDEGQTVELAINAIDPEGEEVTLTFGTPFDSNGVWQTGYEDSGSYAVTVTASDGVSESEETFTVTVNEVNRAPTFADGAFD